MTVENSALCRSGDKRAYHCIAAQIVALWSGIAVLPIPAFPINYRATCRIADDAVRAILAGSEFHLVTTTVRDPFRRAIRVGITALAFLVRALEEGTQNYDAAIPTLSANVTWATRVSHMAYTIRHTVVIT